MVSIDMLTPQEMLKKIAQKARAKRLSLDLSQQTLAEKSGVAWEHFPINIKKDEALETICQVSNAVNKWKIFAEVVGVSKLQTNNIGETLSSRCCIQLRYQKLLVYL